MRQKNRLASAFLGRLLRDAPFPENLRSGMPILDDIVPVVYNELRRLAHVKRRQLRPYETINTTALVHEAYLKLAGSEAATWQNRTHFMRIAARAMRDVVVDYARKQQAQKRGGDAPHVSLHDLAPLPDVRVDEVLSLHDALDRLETIDARQARVVEMRYFVGMSVQETADALDVSPATVKRDWTSARAWLYRQMHDAPDT